ncbi:MAG: tandem-95 repeat protein [Bacteroidetes bacterium]|nr:tandem-95 repeat protein [Bacteroidota bacterium]
MRKVGFIFFLLTFLFIKSTIAQQLLRGQIIKAGSSVLDPNQDGFVTKTAAGFSTSTNYWVPEFEVNMFGIPQVNGDATGDNTGKSCGITDLIPDTKGHSVYAVKDANNNLIFRFRVGDDNPSVEAWTILLDTDGLFGANDPNATAENPGFEIDVTLIKNQNFGVIVYNIDGISSCSTPLITYPLDTHFQISVADEASCGDPDYFYDFYVSVADLASVFGISLNTGVRFAAATNVSATCAMGGKIADISGVNDDDAKYAHCNACAFTDIVSNQCPTAIINLCETCSGFNSVPVNAPGINQPVRAGQTSVSGTCDNGIYIVVQVFPVIAGTTNQWSATPRETDAAYATGINWSVALAGPLQNYDKIVATAQKDANTPPCGLNGGSQSSTSVTVVQPNAPPVAQNQSVNVSEDTPTGVTLVATDPDSDPLTYTIVSSPAHGTLTGAAPNVTYAPSSNYNGADTFTFKASDGIFTSNTATVSINVTQVNDAPVANSQSITTQEDTSAGIILTGSDIEGSPLTYIIVTQPQHGILTGSGANLTYTPVANYNGVDNFTFKVNDGGADSNNNASVLITITPANDPPSANNQSVSVTEDVSTSVILSGSDPDGDILIYTILTQPVHGTLTGTAPNLTYTPTLNYNGSDSFTFKVNDGTVDSNTATISITVAPVNDAPVATTQSVTVTEDIAKAITLTASDVDGNALTYSVVSSPTHGALSGSAPNLTYTPAANYNGNDSFTFKVNDGTVDSNVAMISITVTPVNDAPVANSQSVTTPEDTQMAINLTGSDVDGNALTYIVVASPAHGALSGTTPNLTYTPALNYNGSDSFTFKVNDGTVDSNSATVSITVTPVNDAPVADNQSVTYTHLTAKPITLTGSDVDGNPLTYILVTGPTHGSVGAISGQSITYTPDASDSPDQFTFKVNDGTTDSNIATLFLNLQSATNSPPITFDQSVVTNEDVSQAIILVASDPDGNALLYTIVNPPAHGAFSGAAPNLTYTPALNYNGNDSFTFKVNDGSVDSNTATVSINVTPVNDAPIADAKSVITAEDAPSSLTLTGSDVDGNALTYIVVVPPAHGSLSGTVPNLTYTPAPNYNGSDNFTFKVNDGTIDSNIATVSITVTPANDAPIANAQGINTNEDTPANIQLTATDIEGDPVTYSVLSQPTHGLLSGAVPNITYSPDLNFNGADSFTFIANDGSINSGPATISITVSPVNDAPVANSQSVALAEDIPVSIILTAADVDGNVLTYTIATPPSNGTLSGTAPGLIYTPSANYFGIDNFTFYVNDGTVNSNTATVSLTITPVNDAPTSSDQTITVAEDNSVTIILTGNDVDGDQLTFIIVTPPTNGTLAGSGSTLTYTPNSNYSGTDSFTYEVSDGSLNSNVSAISITVTPVNDAPTANNQSGANNQSVTTAEDVPAIITLTATDVDGDPLTYDIVTPPANGAMTGTPPNVTYTPSLNFNGQDSFTFKANDGITDSNVATVAINVTPVNDPPSILPIPTIYTLEDAKRLVCLSVVDVDSNVITFTSPGNLLGGGDMTKSSTFGFCFDFNPAKNYNGRSTWTLGACDDGTPALCTTINVVIAITPVNDPPVAVDDSYDVIGRSENTFDVLTNDLVIETPYKEFYDIYEKDSADVLVIDRVISFKGNATITNNGTAILYKPNFDWIGPDSIRYRIYDRGRLYDSATVFISVGPPPFKVYQALSPNGDGKNDYWHIDGIEKFPNNTVHIFDRFNNVVFETRGYSNETNNWYGQSNHGLARGSLAEGTYFYSVELGDGRGPISGYVVLKRN